MKEILERIKNKYLSFDKSKSNKNFRLKENHLMKDSTNNQNILTTNRNIFNSNEFLSPIAIKLKILTERKKDINNNNKNIFFNKTLKNLKFGDIYSKSMKKIFKKRIKKKLPELTNIKNSSNIIVQNIRRYVLFTEDDYPYSLNDYEYGYKTLRSREKKDILKEKKCILEQIDNEEYMSKLKDLFNEELINKEKIYFNEKSIYNNIINKLTSKINIFIFDNNTYISKEFYVKRDYKIYLAGKLSINSILIKIVELDSKQEKNIFLPFLIIPLYLSVPRNIFYFFISKILTINNNSEYNNIFNEIIIDEQKIEYFFKIMSSNIQLFDYNSILFDDKILEEETFYLFIKDKTYNISIIPPYIELSKNSEKIKIKKIVSKGLWLTLYGKDFKNWDILCLLYLYSFYDFRQIQYSTIKFHSDKIIDLNIDAKNKKNFCVPKIKEIDKKISFYIYNYEMLKNENLFLFMTLYFYSIDQIYDIQQYKLYFSLEQTRIILGLNNDNNNLLAILYKCSLENEDNKGINLNFPLIKTIQTKKLNNYFNIDNTNKKSYNKRYSKSYKYKYKQGLNILLNLPFIEIKEINRAKIITQYFQLKEEILNKINELNNVEMIKYFGNFVINTYNLDITSNKNRDKKSPLRDPTANNIKPIKSIKNISITKSQIAFNNNKNRNTGFNLRNSLINIRSKRKINLK